MAFLGTRQDKLGLNTEVVLFDVRPGQLNNEGLHCETPISLQSDFNAVFQVAAEGQSVGLDETKRDMS